MSPRALRRIRIVCFSVGVLILAVASFSFSQVVPAIVCPQKEPASRLRCQNCCDELCPSDLTRKFRLEACYTACMKVPGASGGPAPLNLTALRTDGSTVHLNWDPPPCPPYPIVWYDVTRSVNGGDFLYIGGSDSPTFFDDTNAPSGSQYSYIVYAFYDEGSGDPQGSDPSNTATVGP
jgi:hypothetical protein